MEGCAFEVLCYLNGNAFLVGIYGIYFLCMNFMNSRVCGCFFLGCVGGCRWYYVFVCVCGGLCDSVACISFTVSVWWQRD